MTRLRNRLAYEAIGLSQKPSLEWSIVATSKTEINQNEVFYSSKDVSLTTTSEENSSF